MNAYMNLNAARQWAIDNNLRKFGITDPDTWKAWANRGGNGHLQFPGAPARPAYIHSTPWQKYKGDAGWKGLKWFLGDPNPVPFVPTGPIKMPTKAERLARAEAAAPARRTPKVVPKVAAAPDIDDLLAEFDVAWDRFTTIAAQIHAIATNPAAGGDARVKALDLAADLLVAGNIVSDIRDEIKAA